MSDLTMLLGIHDALWSESLTDNFEAMGYTINSASSVEEMLSYLGQRNYSGVMMDLNFGRPGSPFIAPAVRIDEAIRQAKAGTKLLGTSEKPEALAAAKEAGITAIRKTEITRARLVEFFTQS